MAPPRLLHVAHDHAWIAWAPPRGVRVADYRLLQLSNLTSPRERPWGPQSGSSTLAKIKDLSPSSWYSFAVKAETRAEESDGPSAITSPPTPWTQTAAAPDVLLLVGRLPLLHADATLRRHFEGMGLRVHAALDEASMARGGPLVHARQLWTEGAQAQVAPRLLVLSPTCGGLAVRAWRLATAEAGSTLSPQPLRLPLPTIVLGRAAWADLGMCDGSEFQHARSPLLQPDSSQTLLHRCSAPPVAPTPRSAPRFAQLAGGSALVFEAGASLGVGMRTSHRLVGLGLAEEAVPYLTADGLRWLTEATRWSLHAEAPTHLPTLAELFARQKRTQASLLFSLDPVHVTAGRTLRREYLAALREATSERRSIPSAEEPQPPCAHCRHWLSRPLFGRFSPAVDRQAEVSDDDVAEVYRAYIERQLAPLRRAGGVTPERLEASAQLHGSEWNVRYQIIDGVAYLVAAEPPPIVNHHHRKRLHAVQQILEALLSTEADAAGGKRRRSPLPDVDFVLNLADAPRVLPMPPLANRTNPVAASDEPQPAHWTAEQLSTLRAPRDCAGFEYSELAHAPHGPFGPMNGRDNLLDANGFVGEACAADDDEGEEEANAGVLPMLGATACCFSADVSFPTVWYDFDASDDEFGRLEAAAARVPWDARRDDAYFRGSIYWYERHGRTAAFARSLVHPRDVDVDWYESIDSTALEADHVSIFGNLSSHAHHKYLLSLEGHSYWSLRLRHLLHLGSAVMHQDLPCHEFWHVMLRPFEHYLPLRRDLSNLMPMLRYARKHEAEVQRMVERARRLARRLLSREAVLDYVHELLSQYASLQHAPVRRHKDALPLAAYGWSMDELR